MWIINHIQCYIKNFKGYKAYRYGEKGSCYFIEKYLEIQKLSTDNLLLFWNKETSIYNVFHLFRLKIIIAYLCLGVSN